MSSVVDEMEASGRHKAGRPGVRGSGRSSATGLMWAGKIRLPEAGAGLNIVELTKG